MATDPQLQMFRSMIEGKSDDEIYATVNGFGGVEAIADGIINGMVGQFNPARAQDCVVGYRITTPDATYPYRVEVSGQQASMTKAEPSDARVTVTISAADFLRLISGLLDPMAALGEGRLQVDGDMMFAMTAQAMFQP